MTLASPASPAVASRMDEIRAAYNRNPRQMTVQLARELGVGEVEVIRALPAGMAPRTGREPMGTDHPLV